MGICVIAALPCPVSLLRTVLRVDLTSICFGSLCPSPLPLLTTQLLPTPPLGILLQLFVTLWEELIQNNKSHFYQVILNLFQSLEVVQGMDAKIPVLAQLRRR